jgi:protein gp37
VPFFFKQWGAWGPDGVRYRTTGNAGQPGTFEKLASCGFAAMVAWTKDEGDLAKGDQIVLMGKKAAGRLLDGTTHDGMPRS